MKRVAKKDFSISTKGLDMIHTIAVVLASVIMFFGVLLGFSVYDMYGSIIISLLVVVGVFIMISPLIIIICLINMMFDYLYNIEQQSKIQYNIDITSRKILEEIQIANSYREQKNI